MNFSKVTLLTFVLVTFLLGYPLVESFDKISGPWLIIFSTIVPIATVYAISFHKHYLEMALSLSVPFIIVTWLQAVEPGQIWVLAHFVLAIFFYAYVLIIFINHLMKIETVNNVLLLGAVSTYLLLGIFWSELYSTLEYILPGSFAFVFNIYDFIYYSFSSLTTLGMGDIIPLTSSAKALTILEAVTGLLFIAALIARLVGVYVVQSTKKEVKVVTDNIIAEQPMHKYRVAKKSVAKISAQKSVKKLAKKTTKKQVVKKAVNKKKTF